MYKCLLCSEDLQNLRRWRRHLLEKHPIDDVIQAVINNFDNLPTKWIFLRECILERDNYRCQKCGKSKKPFEVHHKKYINLKGKDLITLCRSCHRGLFKKELFKKLFKQLF